MFEKAQTIEVSLTDRSVIEAALHTQAKILDVQANAGGAEARKRLNDVKKVLASLDSQKPVAKMQRTGSRLRSWFGGSRIFG